MLSGLTQINRNLPPTPNSGGARDQSPPELGDLGGEFVSPSCVGIQRYYSKLPFLVGFFPAIARIY